MGVQTTACLDLQFQTLGKVKGDSTTTSLGRKGLIEVLAYHHDVVVNRDPQPGTATGQRDRKAGSMEHTGGHGKRRPVPGAGRQRHDREGRLPVLQSRPRRQGAGVLPSHPRGRRNRRLCRRGSPTRRQPTPPTRTNTTSLSFPTERSRLRTSLSVSRPLTTSPEVARLVR